MPLLEKETPEVSPEPEPKLEDLPVDINPATILVESIEHLTSLKPDLVAIQDRDNELRNFIKDLPKKEF